MNVTVWGAQAEACGKYLAKGRGVLIVGKLKFDTWEKDGQKHSKLSVTAKSVQFMGGREEGGEPRVESIDGVRIVLEGEEIV